MILFNEIFNELYLEKVVNGIVITVISTGLFLLFITKIQSEIYTFM
jgi:hypothetical protein